MVESTLTKDVIDAGKALVRELDNAGLTPDAAFWFYFPDIQAWKLVIAEIKVGLSGPKEVYRQIKHVLGKRPENLTLLSLDDITLAKPDAPIVGLLRRLVQTGSGISDIRLKRNVIDGTLIEDAYVYRLSRSSDL